MYFIEKGKINSSCILIDFFDRQNFLDVSIGISAVGACLLLTVIQNSSAVFFNIYNVGVNVGNNRSGCAGITLNQNLNVQLFRNLCQINLYHFLLDHLAGVSNLLLGKAIDDLKLLFWFCYDCAEGDCVFNSN